MGFYGFSGPQVLKRDAWPKADDPYLTPIHSLGDEFTDNPINNKWTQRNIGVGHITFPPGLTKGMRVRFDAQGDMLLQPAPSGDFELMMHVRDYTAPSGALYDGMLSLIIIDSAGAGIGTSLYTLSGANAPIFNWTLSGYAYNATGNTIAASTAIAGKDYWLSLRKTGTDYQGRASPDGITWSAFITANSNAFVVDRIGIGRMFTNGGTDLTATLVRFNVFQPTYTP